MSRADQLPGNVFRPRTRASLRDDVARERFQRCFENEASLRHMDLLHREIVSQRHFLEPLGPQKLASKFSGPEWARRALPFELLDNANPHGCDCAFLACCEPFFDPQGDNRTDNTRVTAARELRARVAAELRRYDASRGVFPVLNDVLVPERTKEVSDSIIQSLRIDEAVNGEAGDR